MIEQQHYVLSLSGSVGGLPIVVGPTLTTIHTAGGANTVDHLDLYLVSSDKKADVTLDIEGTTVVLAVDALSVERMQIVLDGSATPSVLKASTDGPDVKALGAVKRSSPRVA
jgi:hypothetical protein